MPRLLYVVNTPRFFLTHRLPLAEAAHDSGYEVAVATGPGPESDIAAIRRAGFSHYTLPASRNSTNPVNETRLCAALSWLYRKLRPDLVHLVTIKPVLYGGLLARLFGIPGVVSAISGMGHLYTDDRHRLLRKGVEHFYGAALGHPNGRVIVQNDRDRHDLLRIGALPPGRDIWMPGSGVDLERFRPTPLPGGKPVVTLPARMVWDKGVGEFVEAARRLHREGVEARFALVGPEDPESAHPVPRRTLQALQLEGAVEWWGFRDDMPEVLAASSLVALPSTYREGMPKALQEAAASGRAIVTSDAPGCRDVVDPGVSGELIEPGNAEQLADTMGTLLADRARLEGMGEHGRRKAEAEFGVERVVAAHMDVYSALCA